MSKFIDLANETGLPEPALKPIIDAWQTAESLILQNNRWVAQVNAAKATDPNNVEYLDSLWKSHEKDDEKIGTLAEEFYEIAEKYETLLKNLREESKKHIPEALDEKQTAEVRKQVNESAPAIATAVASAKAMVSILDSVLAPLEKGVPGGLISLLPEVESLKNQRGRKAGTTLPGGGYMTRVDEILINGKSTNKTIDGESKGKFNFAADELSKLWGAEKFPENRVTAEQLEIAFLNKHGYEDRAASKADKESKLPEGESTFDFDREITVPNGNDDSTKKLPQKVQIKVKRPVKSATTETPKVETENTNTHTPAPVEAPKVENAQPTNQPTKVETKQAEPVAAKKTTAPAAKK